MKTLAKIFLVMAVVSFVAGCNSTDDFEFENASSSKPGESKMVTRGFNIVLTGEYLFQGPDPICGDFPPMVRVTNAGEGTGTHLGHLSSYFDFCVDVTDSTYPHGYMIAYLEDGNGDKIYVEIPSGQVLAGRLPGMPSFATSYFRDEFHIIGGTGRFEDASGSGVTNDYNYIAKDGINYTSHHWQGTITMKNK